MELLNEADDRKILDNLEKYPMDKFSMMRGEMNEATRPEK
jgi:hypothetical protein